MDNSTLDELDTLSQDVGRFRVHWEDCETFAEEDRFLRETRDATENYLACLRKEIESRRD